VLGGVDGVQHAAVGERYNMSGDWLNAGQFARRARLSAKALRLYARDGVLVPAQIDPGNGYRRYHINQLRDARIVRLLRRVGMPLVLVRQVLAAPRPERSALVEAFWADAERMFNYRRELVTHLTRTLNEGEESYPMYEINTRNVAEQTVLTEQANVTVPELRDWIVNSGRRQLAAAAAIGGQTGPRMVVYHGEVSEDSDGPVEQITPVSPDRIAEAAVPTRTEAAHHEAYVTITRAQIQYPDIVSAYDAVEQWIASNGRTIAGPPREIYFADPSVGPSDEAVADIAFPIEP
jgi:DNA-binding transcriptional MerR regulator